MKPGLSNRRARAPALALALLTLVTPGCSSSLERSIHPASAGPPTAPAPLKGHLRDGSIVIFENWRYDEATRVVSGSGTRLDALRQIVPTAGALAVPLDSIALFETNVLRRGMSGAVVALTIVVGVVAAICIVDPKSCFGSCPTFYLEDAAGWRLVAESFSGSVLPALEATDVDALPLVRPRRGVVELRMTNEAQETHVVRGLSLLHVARPADGRVWATQEGAFVITGLPLAPTRATGPEGDVRASVAALDGVERSSTVDSTDLGAREVLELEFAAAPVGDLGLVLSTRQTLLSTYLMYQGLAWLGTQAGSWLSRVEGSGPLARMPFGPLQQALGGLTITVEQAGVQPWSVQRTPFETGPIAVDTRIVSLGRGAALPGKPIRLRLELTRGNVRIDRVALAGVRGAVVPERTGPFEVARSGTADAAALRDLLDPERTLVTLPGDTCTIRFRLPAAAARAPENYEWFLEGRGYYLEWIRREWLAEEDPRRLQHLLMTPGEALKILAPEYARGEAVREDVFWRSRFGPATR